MSLYTRYTQVQSVIEISMIAVDDVPPSGSGGLPEIRELVRIHVMVASHCLAATEALTKLHISGQDEEGTPCSKPLGEEQNSTSCNTLHWLQWCQVCRPDLHCKCSQPHNCTTIQYLNAGVSSEF